MQLLHGLMRTTVYLDLVNSPKIYFPPYDSLIKESNTTTKLRVAFDASMKTSSGLLFIKYCDVERPHSTNRVI